MVKDLSIYYRRLKISRFIIDHHLFYARLFISGYDVAKSRSYKVSDLNVPRESFCS